MTENKRFMIDKRARLEKDYAIRDYGELINQDEICDLLNELNDENQAVKDILNELNEIDEFWDSALLQDYITKIANVVGVELDD